MLERFKTRVADKDPGNLEAIDVDLREKLDQVSEDRFAEASDADLIASSLVFGQPVETITIMGGATEFVKVHRPHLDAQVAGYVPLQWIEFTTDLSELGCFIEVRGGSERLIGTEATNGGNIPFDLPLDNTRVMVAKALNTLEGGILLPSVSQQIT